MNWTPSNIACLVLFILYILSSIIEIIFCFLNKEKLRKIFKPFPMILLLALIFVKAPTHWALYLGAFFGLVGDLFLLSEKRTLFYAGCVAFFLGHLFYFLEILVNVCIPLNVPFFVYIILGCIALCMVILLFKKFKEKLHDTIFSILGVLYFFWLIANSILSFVCAGIGSTLTLLVGFGNLIFLFSDLMVFKSRLVKKSKFDQFLIMPTYLLAQILIVSGLLLLVL